MSLKRFYSLLFLVVIVAVSAFSAPVVKAKLDSVTIVMGRTTTLTLTVTQQKNIKGNFPLLSAVSQNGVIPVCGDSVEFRTPSKIDTIINGDIMNITLSVPVQSFDSGLYKLPELVYVAGHDTVMSNSLHLKVVPVAANADDPIYDYAGTADPADPSIFDILPDWLLDYWWIVIIVAAAIAVFVVAIRRYRVNGSFIPPKPQPSPYEVAIYQLNLLKDMKLWEQGLEKEYFTELTDILRNYLEKRFGINAMEMTSRQIMESLTNNPEVKDKRQYFRQILDMADFVKFAKVRPLPDDNIASFDNALKFVEETKPMPVVSNDDQSNINNTAISESSKKGGDI